ncbi:3-deoxy-7-phosphoheptulonate synthase [Kitasatospora sp. NPDC056783]|uniref:3-deoxy-7-phosphoheptulonate synthase n=1 Tax=Kitasatospora sp. NPDC056783 TaxID=3345943 RepID=UPI00368A11DB
MHKVAQWKTRPADQQPTWPDEEVLWQVHDELRESPALVRGADVRTLREQLARVAAGELQVIQSGDCAEDPAEATSGHVARKSALLDVLAGVMKGRSHKPVIRVGRLAGQFGKPRSNPTEVVDGVELPVYRGHMVNAPEADPDARRPDPKRLISGYRAASDVTALLGWACDEGPSPVEAPVWTSHEALLLDYESAMLRHEADGSLLLASTHWPWIGERTRRLDGAHVAFFAALANPVSVKVGPTMTPEQLLELCERLDPLRQAGRLTLISRMGAGNAAERLPALVRAVRAAGYPVIWLCDPMHGNTVCTPHNYKTRYVETVVQEIREFQAAVDGNGGVAGGLHLETTPDDVFECAQNASEADRIGDKYTSYCDPRLNPSQAADVVSVWHG